MNRSVRALAWPNAHRFGGEAPNARRGVPAGGRVGRRFDAYVFVDWSASSAPGSPKPSADAVWVGHCSAGGRVQTESYHRTRRDAARSVLSLLTRCVKDGLRVLVGFDFPYGYPAGFGRSLGIDAGPHQWLGVWAELAKRVRDDDQNRNNRFDVAREMNAAAGAGRPGPFWMCPARHAGPNLQPRSPGFPFGTSRGVVLQRLREVEARLPGTQEAWKLCGVGSVGSQALVGIPYVHQIRFAPSLASISRVWPFETGFTPSPLPEPGPFILHAEIWPGLVKERTAAFELSEPQGIRDQAQVRAMCKWAAEMDEGGDLGGFFAQPEAVGSRQLRAALEEEGWVLGAR